MSESAAEKVHTVQQNLRQCAQKAGRKADDIQLIAVSKTRPLEDVVALVDLGLTAFGENTVQDAMQKIPHFSQQNIEWHFIGHLQSKKAGKIPGYFQWVHSVDSLKLARKLSAAMQRYSGHSSLNCLIQVNVSEEPSKFGISPDQTVGFLEELVQLDLPCLRWRGLMTIGIKGDEDQTRTAFRRLHALHAQCRAVTGNSDFDQLSMGMSADYCLAIEEGATMIRVGTSLFGERSYA